MTGQLEGNEVKSLACRLGWTVKGVEHWFRNKHNHSKPSKMTKSKENWYVIATYLLFIYIVNKCLLKLFFTVN